MPETKSAQDFLSDGILNYGVVVGRFVFERTGKTVYAISVLSRIAAADVMMFYQITKLNYQRLLGMAMPDRIPEPPIPASVTDACRRRFLCGESVYCRQNSFSIFQTDKTLIADTLPNPSDNPALSVSGRFRSFREEKPAKPLSSTDQRSNWVLIKAGKLDTLSKGMGYHLYCLPDGKIVCETLCGESIIAKSIDELQRISPDKLEEMIYSCEMDRAR